jgi:hypothetical protein
VLRQQRGLVPQAGCPQRVVDPLGFGELGLQLGSPAVEPHTSGARTSGAPHSAACVSRPDWLAGVSGTAPSESRTVEASARSRSIFTRSAGSPRSASIRA